MLKSYSRTWTEIDYSAIPHNLDEIQKLIGKTKIMGIVKANAYGHGDVECARVMADHGVDFFGVSSVDEALNLRQGGIEEDILILGYTPPEHFHYLMENNLVQSLVSLDYAKKLSAYAQKHGGKIRAHAKIDTGMNRTGVIYQDEEKHIDDLKKEYRLPGLQVEGIFSHFPVSDDLSSDARSFTENQIRLFDEAIDLLKKDGIDPGLRHIQNSYGILNYFDLGYEYARPGLLYMGVTSDDSVPIESNPDFIPILSLKSNVSYVRWVQPGATISYGRTYTIKQPSKVATISIGYADGLPRLLSGSGFEVLIHGKRAKLLGRICMDQCMVDVTDIEGVKEGDEVVLVGRQKDDCLTIDDISRKTGTINNETLCRITARVPRMKARSGK